MECWNSGILGSGIMGYWDFFTSVLIVLHLYGRIPMFLLSFHYSIIPSFLVGRGRMVGWELPINNGL
jgi:hypothetical protein